jgi:hypothetical protein
VNEHHATRRQDSLFFLVYGDDEVISKTNPKEEPMKRTALTIVTLALTLTGALAATPASADTGDGGTDSQSLTAGTLTHAADGADSLPSWLTPEQRAALTNVGAPVDVTDRSSISLASGGGGVTAAKKACKTKSMSHKLYRGSVLMWTEDTLKFTYSSCEKKVTSSSLSQRAGYVFPNVAKAKGTTKYYSATAKHKWHGLYAVGAGVVTPWGDVTVYMVDIRSDWEAEVMKLSDGQMIGHLTGEWE